MNNNHKLTFQTALPLFPALWSDSHSILVNKILWTFNSMSMSSSSLACCLTHKHTHSLRLTLQVKLSVHRVHTSMSSERERERERERICLMIFLLMNHHNTHTHTHTVTHIRGCWITDNAAGNSNCKKNTETKRKSLKERKLERDGGVKKAKKRAKGEPSSSRTRNWVTL